MNPTPRDAAFGAHPEALVRDGTGALDRWLVAVALGGQGHYAAAAVELGRLLVDPGTPPAVAAHAAVTRAAHRRQLGGHRGARRDDALALRLAAAAPDAPGDDDGTDPAAARIDALVGLAADAVGLAAPDVAARLVDVAGRVADGHPSWRLPVRMGWVRAEVALVRGRPSDAVGPAAGALRGALGAGSVRHALKSRLVLVVARGAAGVLDPAGVVMELDSIAQECDRRGLLPLAWACGLAAADVLDRQAVTANDSATRMAQRSALGTPSDPTRRRHAVRATADVLRQRSDPVGRRLLGESV